MHHSMQGHQLDRRDNNYQQSYLQYHQINHTAPQSSILSHNKVYNQTQTISATLDRRTIGNSTVSPPVFCRQRSFESSTSYKRKDHNFETSDTIESFPNRNSSTLSPKPQELCRVTNLNSSLCESNSTTSGILHVDSSRSIGILPSSAHLDATVTCLWILTPLTATISAVIVLISITTNQWLHTEENMINPSYNGSGERDQLSKFTVSGLWKLCYTTPGGHKFECSKIDYFPKEEYLPDPNDSTMAIPYAVTRSSVFLLLATAILFIGYMCCLIGHCARHRRIYTFTSGVLFIISGLLMLIGLVMYISVFKAEVGSKLRQPSFTQGPAFTYRYGYSFILYVCGFMTIEMAGTSAVFLFIYWYQKDWLVKLTEKYSSGSDSNISYTNLDQNSVYPCKKHPQVYTIPRSQPIGASYEPSTSGVSPNKRRKFVFDQETLAAASPSCSFHKNKNVYVSSSMRDVSGASQYRFPPPPQLNDSTFGEPYVIDYPEVPRSANPVTYRTTESVFMTGGGSTRSLHLVGSNTMPRDATTNTTSTTVDIVTPNEEFGFVENTAGQVFETFSPGAPRDFMSFDLERSLELKPAASVAIGHQTLKKDFSCGTETLRRTTPV